MTVNLDISVEQQNVISRDKGKAHFNSIQTYWKLKWLKNYNLYKG